jgi:O-antigen/teichoic acid export membrane protein
MESEPNPPSNPSSKAKILSFLFKNKNPKQTVAKNTFWLTVSNFGGKAIRAIIVIYAARALGAVEYGVFSYAITLAGFMSLIMDPGINTVLMRDASRSAESEEDRRTIFGTTLVMKLVLLAAGVSIIVFIGPYFSTLPGAIVILPIVAFVLMFDTLRDFFLALLRARERMEWDAGITVLTNLAIVILGFIFLAISPSAKGLVWGYAIGSFLGTCAAAIVLRDYIKSAFSWFSVRLVKPIIASAWPFAIAGALGLLLTNTDILIISWMRTAAEVGIYAAGIRIIQTLYLVPAVLQASTLPLFARLANNDNARFRVTLERVVSTLFLISIPMTVGGIFFGTHILSAVFGSAFVSGATAFKILVITVLIDYPGSIIGTAIFAYGHQKSLIITSAIAGVLNVALDILLIPRFGMTGSAVGTLIAQAASNGYLWYVMNRINPFSIFHRLYKVIAASAIMFALAVILAFIHVEVFANIALCIVLYFAILAALRDPLLREVTGLMAARYNRV